jgi:hypothetical protein
MSTEFVLPAALFSDEPVWRDVVFNQDAIDAAEAERDDLLAEVTNASAADAVEIPEPQIVPFLLLPVTSEMDAEYTRLRGHNESHLRFRPQEGAPGKSKIEFEPIDRVFSNDRELKAITWIAKKVIKGWHPFRNTDGALVEFSELNLKRLCGYSQYIRPPVAEAYKIADIKSEVEEKNSETSFVGSASPSEDQNGMPTGEAAEITK